MGSQMGRCARQLKIMQSGLIHLCSKCRSADFSWPAILWAVRLRRNILAGSSTQFTVAADYLETVKNNFPAAVHASCNAAYAAGNVSSLYDKGYAMLSRNGRDTLYNDLAACSAFDSTVWISSIAVPVLVICGSDDKITPPESSQQLAQLIPEARLKILAGAGHMVMMEEAAEFNEAIKTFILQTTGITEGLCDLK